MKTTTKIISMCTVLGATGLIALSFANKCNVSVVKAENNQKILMYTATTTPQLFSYYPDQTPLSTVYVDGELYPNVDSFTISGLATNKLQLVQILDFPSLHQQNFTDFTTMALVQGIDNYVENGIYSYFTEYDYNVKAFRWIDAPNWVDIFGSSTYKNIPMTNTTGVNDGYYVIYNGYFTSNGHNYTRIRIRLQNLYGTNWRVNGENVIFDNYNNYEYRYYSYAYGIYYENVLPNQYRSDLVSKIDGTTYNGTGYLVPNYKWTNAEYRSVMFYGISGEPNIPNNIYPSYNDILNRVNYGVQTPTDDNLENVFSLMTLMFNSMLPILNLRISKTITLGILILTPITLGIILAIIKLVKR